MQMHVALYKLIYTHAIHTLVIILILLFNYVVMFDVFCLLVKDVFFICWCQFLSVSLSRISRTILVSIENNRIWEHHSITFQALSLSRVVLLAVYSNVPFIGFWRHKLDVDVYKWDVWQFSRSCSTVLSCFELFWSC